MKRLLVYFIPLIILTSCLKDDGPTILGLDYETRLSDFLMGQTFIKDQVIACAASDNEIQDVNNVYFYPEEGATDFRLYQSWAEDENDFSSYEFAPLDSEPFFQGALRVFKLRSDSKWTIVIFEKDGKIEISTPIRMKLHSQPTIWGSTLNINQETSLMPRFSWSAHSEENSAIFFQVMATDEHAFLSGTYTQDSHFQYYNLNNVVLNVTSGIPPPLVKGETYIFTVMDVSLDNWVNQVIALPFTAE